VDACETQVPGPGSPLDVERFVLLEWRARAPMLQQLWSDETVQATLGEWKGVTVDAEALTSTRTLISATPQPEPSLLPKASNHLPFQQKVLTSGRKMV
jgi:hypothetical protein